MHYYTTDLKYETVMTRKIQRVRVEYAHGMLRTSTLSLLGVFPPFGDIQQISLGIYFAVMLVSQSIQSVSQLSVPIH